MSENDMNEYQEWEAFKIFAKMHPIEAYDSNPTDFCKFMRSEGFDFTDEQIKKLVDLTR